MHGVQTTPGNGADKYAAQYAYEYAIFPTKYEYESVLADAPGNASKYF